MAVKFRIDQATRSAGVDDETRWDLVPGQVITLTAVEPPPATGLAYEWELIDKTNASTELSAGTGISVQLPAPNNYGYAFLIELRVRQNGTIIGSSQRIAGCLTMNRKLSLPLFSETADPRSKLGARNEAGSTNNATYSNRGGTGETAKNWRGWTELLYQLVMAVENPPLPPSDLGGMPISYRVRNAVSQLYARADHWHDGLDLYVLKARSFSAEQSFEYIFGSNRYRELPSGPDYFFHVYSNASHGAGTPGETVPSTQNMWDWRCYFAFDIAGSLTFRIPRTPTGVVIAAEYGREIRGVQAGDGRITFVPDSGVQIRFTDQAKMYTTGKGCTFSLVRSTPPWAGSLDNDADIQVWDLTISGAEGAGGGVELPPGSGDVAGTYPALTVTGLRGHAVNNAEPADGQTLLWDDTTEFWTPGFPGVEGDVTGRLDATTVVALQGVPVLNSDPWPNATWIFNGLSWEPGDTKIRGFNILGSLPVPGQVLTLLAGDGENPDYWAAQDLPTPSGDAVSLRGVSIEEVAGNQGDVLTLVDGSWRPAAQTGGGGDATSIRGRAVDAVEPVDGDALTWDAGDEVWLPKAPRGFSEVYAIDFRTGSHSWASDLVDGTLHASYGSTFFELFVEGQGSVSLIEGEGLKLVPRQDGASSWDNASNTGITATFLADLVTSCDMIAYIRVASVDGGVPKDGDWIGVHIGAPAITRDGSGIPTVLSFDGTYRATGMAAQYGFSSGNPVARLVLGQGNLSSPVDNADLSTPGSFWLGLVSRGLMECHLGVEPVYTTPDNGVWAPYSDEDHKQIHGFLSLLTSSIHTRRRHVGIHVASSTAPYLASATISHLVVYQRNYWDAYRAREIAGPGTGGEEVGPNTVTMTIYLNNMADQAAMQAALESFYAGLAPGQAAYAADVAAVISPIGVGFIYDLIPEEPTDAESKLVLGTVNFQPSGEG